MTDRDPPPPDKRPSCEKRFWVTDETTELTIPTELFLAMILTLRHILCDSPILEKLGG